MKNETFNEQARIALAAICNHALDNGLPTLMSTEVLTVEQVVRVRVGDEAAQTAWLNTLVIEDEHNESWQGPIWIKTTWKVRLPDLGIGFELRGLRQMPQVVVDLYLSESQIALAKVIGITGQVPA